MSKPIYAETIKICDRWYNEERIVLITSNLSISPYDNHKLWLVKGDVFTAENDGYKRID